MRNLPASSHAERPKSSESKKLWANVLSVVRKWFSKDNQKDKQALKKKTAAA
jgi:hypothetical protein